MENETKRKDTITKIILIVIIIILLLHSCAFSHSKTPSRTPSGNVNVIEITCDKQTDCDTIPKTDKPTSNIVPEPATKTEDNQTTPEEEKTGCVERDGKYYDNNGNIISELDYQKQCMINICKILSDGTYYGAHNNEISEGEFYAECESEGNPYIKDDEFGVIDRRHNKITWNGSSDLKIFTNSIYELNDVIAPEMSNTYQFVIRNDTDYKMFYNMSFEETNPYNIDMRYKLKKNDTYIIDHYVGYDELVVSTKYLSADQHDTYYLEWKWFSGDNDTQAGRNEAPYNLRINVEAESTNG